MRKQRFIITIIASLFIGFTLNAQNNLPHQPVDFSKPNFVETHEDGTVKQTGFVIKNKNEGNWKRYYENGNTAIEGNYASGKKTGEWKYYDQDGMLVGKVLWVRDRVMHKEIVETVATGSE